VVLLVVLLVAALQAAAEAEPRDLVTRERDVDRAVAVDVHVRLALLLIAHATNAAATAGVVRLAASELIGALAAAADSAAAKARG